MNDTFVQKFLRSLAMGLLALACTANAHAQLKYTEGSFKATSGADIQAGGDDLGQKNFAESLTRFEGQHDDASLKSAIIRLRFSNLASEDIDRKVKVDVNPGYVNGLLKYTDRTPDRTTECWVNIDPGNDLTLTVTLDGIGSVRIPGIDAEGGRMYTLTIASDELVPVTFSSNVTDTQVWFDNIALGRIDGAQRLTKDKTAMGRHRVKAVAGDVVREFDIDVSRTNTHFPLDMLRRYRVPVTSNESGVSLYEGTVSLGPLPAEIELSEGAHSFTVRKPGYDDVVHNVNITSAAPLRLDIHKSRTIDFYALRHNTDLAGATVYINHEAVGTTPLSHTLPYGRYDVRMSYGGRDKSKKLVVDDNTPSRLMLTLPGAHRRFNPFDIPYVQRSGGFSVGYVQKWMRLSAGSSILGLSYLGEERHMHGLQAGIPIKPVFGYGMGLNTGLFFECYFDSTDDTPEGDTMHLYEYCLYMPVDFMFRLPLAEQFSIYVTGGIGIDWSIKTVLTQDGYDDYSVDYGDWGAPAHFNFSAEFGGALQFRCLELSAKYQIGLNDNSKFAGEDAGDVTARMRKLQFTLGFLF